MLHDVEKKLQLLKDRKFHANKNGFWWGRGVKKKVMFYMLAVCQFQVTLLLDHPGI